MVSAIKALHLFCYKPVNNDIIGCSSVILDKINYRYTILHQVKYNLDWIYMTLIWK